MYKGLSNQMLIAFGAYPYCAPINTNHLSKRTISTYHINNRGKKYKNDD
jgi:hypothetical protein